MILKQPSSVNTIGDFVLDVGSGISIFYLSGTKPIVRNQDFDVIGFQNEEGGAVLQGYIVVRFFTLP